MSLKKIYNNRKKILEGITNSLLKNEFVEQVALERSKICDTCEFKGNKCAVPGTGPCCNDCGCSLYLKHRALSDECPKGKWGKVLDEQDEEKLKQL